MDPSKNHVRRIRTRARDCECCGGADLEELWSHQFEARTKSGSFLFDTRNVICRTCGFVFVSPVYDQADLDEYYVDAFPTFEQQALDYDISVRLAAIDLYKAASSHAAEIGSNQLGKFQTELAKRFERVTTIE